MYIVTNPILRCVLTFTDMNNVAAKSPGSA